MFGDAFSKSVGWRELKLALVKMRDGAVVVVQAVVYAVAEALTRAPFECALES